MLSFNWYSTALVRLIDFNKFYHLIINRLIDFNTALVRLKLKGPAIREHVDGSKRKIF